MAEILLAKSEPQVTLKQHTIDGLEIWRQLQISFPLTPSIAGKENFWWLLRLAIITHDLGKAHSEFQKILKGEPESWRKQRHELFSLPFTANLPLNDLDKKFVLRVVAAHHRSYEWLRTFISSNYEVYPHEFEREFSMVDIVGAVEIANELENELLPQEIQSIRLEQIIIDYKREARIAARQPNDENKDFFTQLLMMGAFHQCDHLSSGFVTLLPNLESEDFGFLDKMKEDLMLKEFDFYDHQIVASKSLGNVILTAPTGSGKTETAMLWLRNQLNRIGQGRVFYILPFTASINAMFERLGDNNGGLGKGKVGMLHGKVNAYLYDNFFGEAGGLKTLKSKIKDAKEQFKNLETPLKVSTPFQLLKHLFGLKGFEKGIFEWTGGHFIFDEIHAYDPEVTAQIIVLLEFLAKKMEAKVFIMTATLPSFLKRRIKVAIGEKCTEIKAADQLYGDFKRHRLRLADGLLSENFTKIQKELASGKSVLVVCNTVDSSRSVYDHFKGNEDLLLLHGRFAAKDRNEIEKKLRNSPPKLLIGTQAIEVSLDIDYDTIFTEPAPLDALIQRFGRVNRKRSKSPCTCHVFRERNEKDKYVYEDDLIKRTLEVLEEIESKNDGVIQEIELQGYIDLVYPDFSEEALEKFDKVYTNLKSHIKRLFPFDSSKEGEEAYYKQFDGVKILPAFYEKQFKYLLKQFDFIGAEQLKVSLRSNRFGQFLASGDLKSFTTIIANPEREDSEPIEIQYYKLNKKYDPDTGLDFNIEQIIVDSDQFDF